MWNLGFPTIVELAPARLKNLTTVPLGKSQPWCSVGCRHGIYGGRRRKVGGGVLGEEEDMGGLCGGLEGSGAQARLSGMLGSPVV